MAAAVRGGATHLGFVFYPKSPRALSLSEAAPLISALPPSIIAVALMVDPDDAQLDRVIALRPGMIQLHGSESPERVAAIRTRINLPVMKAVGLARTEDLATARPYEPVVDRLLFDAKPPPTADALPGGNGLPFDWRLLAGTVWQVPWMLSGGLNAKNVARAAHLAGARAVDVSSGVESGPGVKDPDAILAFLEAARRPWPGSDSDVEDSFG